MKKNEIIDTNGDSLEIPRSAIEQVVDVKGYNDLVSKINDIGIEDKMDYGDGKTYFPHVGQMVWRTVILATKPMIPKDEREKKLLLSIYKIILAFTMSGEYPLLQQLCNYLGINMDEFFTILVAQNHPSQRVYMWAYNVFEAAATMNAIRSNGNANMRMWIDKSREYKISTETKLELANEQRKITQLEKLGAEIERELLEEWE